jgi:ParB family chromosome partitioning protein
MASAESCAGLTVVEQERFRLQDILPSDSAELWTWCLDRSREELLAVLAFIAASAVNAVRSKSDSADTEHLAQGERLAQALGLDMAAWFAPTAENYFGRISRTQILAAIDEAKGTHAPALAKLKKPELAARAQDLVAGTGWLPEPLRATPKAAE